MSNDDSDVSNVANPASTDDADPPTETASEDYVDTDADDGLATLEDHTLQRDPSGDLKPQRVTDIPELDGADVIAKPLTRQERKQYIQDLVEGSKDEITDAELAELFDRKIVAPDLSEHPLCNGQVTERFVQDGLLGKQEDGYYIAILRASGEDEMVRRMRGELSDTELRALIAAEHGTIPEQGNPRQGDGFRDGVNSSR